MSTQRDDGPDENRTTGVEAYRLRYQEMFEFAPDAHLVTDTQGLILQANHAAATLLRCSKEFLPGKPLGLFVTTGKRARFYESLARMRHSAGSDEFEAEMGRPREVARTAAIRVLFVAASENREATLQWLLADITERRRVEAARDDLMRRLAQAREDERGRIARELHDSFGQLLTALLLGIQAVRNAGPLSEVAAERLGKVQLIADQLARETHDLSTRLRPTVLDDLGLTAALGQLVSDWSDRSGVAVDFQCTGLASDRFPSEVETALYRVVQEALTNVARHARARQAIVILSRIDRSVMAVIEDDGDGFDLEATPQGRLGLLGMHERVAQLGGNLLVESSPGGGTSIIARVPLQAHGLEADHG
jgi:PAS domain S-box-containing protein